MILDSAGTNSAHQSQRSRLGALGDASSLRVRAGRRSVFGLLSLSTAQFSIYGNRADFFILANGAKVSTGFSLNLRETSLFNTDNSDFDRNCRRFRKSSRRRSSRKSKIELYSYISFI